MNFRNWKIVVLTWVVGFAIGAQPGITAPKGASIRGGQKQQVMLFIQDIASCCEPNLRKGTISNKTMIDFGITYNYLRHSGRFQHTGKKGSPDLRVAARHVQEAVKQYFGRAVKNESTAEGKYRASYYIVDGFSFEQLGPVDLRIVRLSNHGNGVYTALADVANEMGEGTTHVKVTFKQVGSGSTSHFNLIEYVKA